jgi:hypothetical protein
MTSKVKYRIWPPTGSDEGEKRGGIGYVWKQPPPPPHTGNQAGLLLICIGWAMSSKVQILTSGCITSLSYLS